MKPMPLIFLLPLLLTGCLAPAAAPTPAKGSPETSPAPTGTRPAPSATLAPPPSRTPTPTTTARPTQPADALAFERNRRLGRAINLGNALEAPREGEWGVVLQAEYFRLIKEAGFASVRIPVRFSAHAQAAAPYTLAPAFLERVDWAVQQATDQGLNAILDMHHYEELMTNPQEQRERFLALWQQLAEHYKSAPASVYFELLNEPNGPLSAGSAWNELIAAAIPLIRQTNPDRTIIVGPGRWNSIGMLFDLRLPAEERNLIVTVHYYDPFQFTHQGAEWVEGAEHWLGTTWEGNEFEQHAIQASFAEADTWARKNARPLFLGEFGAYSQAEMAARARWTAFVARQAEARSWSWAYWEFCAGFGIYDPQSQTWRGPLLEALIP
jgi:endoglucanase